MLLLVLLYLYVRIYSRHTYCPTYNKRRYSFLRISPLYGIVYKTCHSKVLLKVPFWLKNYLLF